MPDASEFVLGLNPVIRREPLATDPAAFDAFFKSEVVRWTDVARRAGLNAQ